MLTDGDQTSRDVLVIKNQQDDVHAFCAAGSAAGLNSKFAGITNLLGDEEDTGSSASR